MNSIQSRLTTNPKTWSFKNKGYKISYTSVKRIVHEWKMRNTGLNEVFIMQVPSIGKRAEFDWGYAPLKIKGVLKSYPLVFMVLNNSLYRYALVFERETLLEVIEGHIQFFRQIGILKQYSTTILKYAVLPLFANYSKFIFSYGVMIILTFRLFILTAVSFKDLSIRSRGTIHL